MKYLNLQTSIIRSPQYVGSDPVPRATWLNLMAYCAEQENGGRIVGAAQWRDRRWQQTCGVTEAEVREECELWHWEGDDLILWGYPRDKEAEVQVKRDTARLNGASGGRPRKTDSEPTSKTQAKPALVSDENQYRFQRRGQDPKAEEKGKERNGMEGGENARVAAPDAPPPRLASPGDSLSSPPPRLVVLPAPDGSSDIRDRLAALWPDAAKAWTAPELRDLAGSADVLTEMTDDDWEAIAAWNEAPLRLIGRKAHWPRDRREHVANAGQVLEVVRPWWRICGREWWQRQQAKKAAVQSSTQPVDEPDGWEPSAEDLAAMHEFLAQPFRPNLQSA